MQFLSHCCLPLSASAPNSWKLRCLSCVGVIVNYVWDKTASRLARSGASVWRQCVTKGDPIRGASEILFSVRKLSLFHRAMCIQEEAGLCSAGKNVLIFILRKRNTWFYVYHSISDQVQIPRRAGRWNCITASISPRFSLSAVNGLSIVLKGGSVNELI